MTEPPEAPDWSLLPRDPARFFGLADGFDRRDLKRSYNQFIRRFKPERFPQEFQRIRAAFEQLDSDIRYGQKASWTNEAAEEYRWLSDTHQTSAHAEPASATPSKRAPQAVPVVLPLHERLKTGSATEIYRELSARTEKSPFDFYALAVMSDALDRKDGLQFARWLLQGLSAHKHDIGLMRLLHAYLRGQIDDNACEKLLLACSKIIHEDAFFPLTEPLWRSLLRSQNFARFRTTLQQCETNLKGMSIDGRLAFYLQILKPAMWIADEAWIEDATNFIEHNFERIPHFLEFDVEIITRLRAYIQHRETFANGHPIQRRLDQALRDYFSEDQLAGDRSVLECQVLITQDTEGLAAAFSRLGDPAFSPFYALWNWVSYDVGERHVEAPEEAPDDSIWHSRTKSLLEQIGRQTDNSRVGVTWAASRIGYRCAQLLCYVGPIALLMGCFSFILSFDANRPRVADPDPNAFPSTFNVGGRKMQYDNPTDAGSDFDPLTMIIAIPAIILGVAMGYWLQQQLRTRVWSPYCMRISARCYHLLWRREVINFLARSHLTYHTLIAFISAESETNAKSGWVKYYVEQDYALPVYALAQRFIV